jgi:hypothetical protein
MLLRELLEQLNNEPKDVEMCHNDYDIEPDPATMVNLCMNGLTEAGQERFKDVLNAEVCDSGSITYKGVDTGAIYVTLKGVSG